MTETEKLNIEKQAVDTLLEQGMTFKAGLFRFHLQQPYLGTLLHMSRLYAEIAIDEEKLKDSAYAGSYMLVPQNAKRVSKLIALAVLRSRVKIKLFAGLLSWYMLWNLTPEKLFAIMGMVLVIGNTASFTNSIRLIQALRMMKPKESLVEQTTKV